MKSLIPVICECCKHPEMIERSYSDIIDSYWLECPNCQHDQVLHFTQYDGVMGYYDNVEENQKEIAFSIPFGKSKISESDKFKQKVDNQFEMFRQKWAKK